MGWAIQGRQSGEKVFEVSLWAQKRDGSESGRMGHEGRAIRGDDAFRVLCRLAECYHCVGVARGFEKK